jgi:heme exporter protein D
MFEFGKYAIYVWPSYGLTALVMLGLLATSLWRLRRNKRALSAYERAGQGRRGRRGDEEGA